KQYREVPLKAILQNVGARTHRIVRVRVDVAKLSGALIETRRQTTVRPGEHDIRIFRRRRNPARLTATDVVPIARADTAFSRATRDAYSRVVLLRAVDVVRKIVVERDAIKLRRGLVLFGPSPAAVIRN